jgi:hypothetical protein
LLGLVTAKVSKGLKLSQHFAVAGAVEGLGIDDLRSTIDDWSGIREA